MPSVDVREVCHGCDGEVEEPGTVWCPDCLSSRTCPSCSGVSERPLDYFGCFVDGAYWCGVCAGSLADQCIECGEYYRNEDIMCCGSCGDVVCESCFPGHEERHDDNDGDGYGVALHHYGYQPPLDFYGTGPLYLGVELEIDGGGESSSNAERIVEVDPLGPERQFYICHDGSLSNGLEIISHPASLQYHRTKFPWKEIMDQATALGYKSHETDTCGMHVHVSREALGGSATERDMTLSKLIVLFWRNWKDIVRFSRRKSDQLYWCRLNISEDDRPSVSTLRDAKYRMGKYAALNTDHPQTIEFRVFRGTLKYQTFIATLQFVVGMVEIAKTHGIGWCARSHWPQLVERIEGKEFHAYVTERGLK